MVRALRRPPPAPTIQVQKFPAPVGGMNRIAAASEMPVTDCIMLFNMVAAEFGLRSRLGSREWTSGVAYQEDASVRTVIPFTGSARNRSKDRIFIATDEAIQDCSASGSSTPVVQFGPLEEAFPGGEHGGDAGWGVYHVAINASGDHFLLYADEQNGYYVYTETTETWAKAWATATVAWAASTNYVDGDLVLNDTGKTYLCTVGGTSAASGGPTGTSSAITDGGVTWSYQANTLGGVDPANVAFVTLFKGRIWFVEKDTANAWYLPAGSIYGTAVKFSLGTKLRAGGSLVGVWNWSGRDGSGPDDRLVAVSSGGDVVVYEGTDPASATSFRIVGTASVGGVPAGRRICLNFGGDLLILSKLGVVPLSKLLGGATAEDPAIYITAKIANLFNSLMLSRSEILGWALQVQPEDNSLLVIIPNGPGQSSDQLVMSIWNGSWSQYRDLPLYSCDSWHGKLYCGTADGRMLINDGYVDGVTLAAPNTNTAVQWALLTSFQDFGNGRKKAIQLIRPSFLTGGPTAYSAAARYKYDFSELATVSAGSGGDGTWGSSTWDSSVWQGDYTATQAVTGAVGMGSEMAVALRGAANSRTVLVRIDVFYTQGGLL